MAKFDYVIKAEYTIKEREYPKYRRIILRKDMHGGWFKTKGEARKYMTKFKHFVKDLDPTQKQISFIVVEEGSFNKFNYQGDRDCQYFYTQYIDVRHLKGSLAYQNPLILNTDDKTYTGCIMIHFESSKKEMDLNRRAWEYMNSLSIQTPERLYRHISADFEENLLVSNEMFKKLHHANIIPNLIDRIY